MKKLKVALITIVFLIGLFYALDFYDIHIDTDKYQTYNVPVQLGKHKFIFQRNYLSKYDSNSVSLEFMLPDYVPLKKENYKEFKESFSKLHINIYNNGIDRISSEEFGSLKDFNNWSKNYCKTEFKLIEPESHHNLEVYNCNNMGKIYTSMDHEYAIYCDGIVTKTFKNPQCKISGDNTIIYGDLNLFYFFDGDYASKSNEIYSFIRSIIETAKEKGKKQ